MCDKHWTKRSGVAKPVLQPNACDVSAAYEPETGAGANLDGAEFTAPGPTGVVAKVLYGAVRFYQKYLSALKMGSTCRFEPTCSAYALEAIATRGAFMGSVLTLVRLAKCGPWHPGGFDPVPLPASMRDADVH